MALVPAYSRQNFMTRLICRSMPSLVCLMLLPRFAALPSRLSRSRAATNSSITVAMVRVCTGKPSASLVSVW